MHAKTSRSLVFYGIFLILIGVLGYLSNPEKAKTALMSGGTFGSLSMLWAFLGKRQWRWSLMAARVSTLFLAVVFIWRSTVTWGKVIGGAPEKTFAACLITSMLIASVIMIRVLFSDRSLLKKV